MAQTTTPEAATVKQWDRKYWKDYINGNWFKGFMGTSSSAMIHVNEELTKQPGDAITFHLVNKLKNQATLGSSNLEGNEEDVDIRTHKVTIDQYRHAVKYPVFEAQKAAIPFREAHKDVLLDWNMELDRDKIIQSLASIDGINYDIASEGQKDTWSVNNADRSLFGNLLSNNTGDHSASLSNVANPVSADALDLMKRQAKAADPKIRPFRARKSVSSSDMYVYFAPSLIMRDLRKDPTFQLANQEARKRGKTNPIFSDADYVYGNIAIYEIEDIQTLPGVGAAGVDVAPSYLMGAQALLWAWGKRPSTVSDEFDYKDKIGLAVFQWYEIEKARFGTGPSDVDNLKDHGVFTGFFTAEPDV